MSIELAFIDLGTKLDRGSI